jgi:NAD(P)-dependent dehydrogenase (short-subunit alcohol dehydrogenase family)
MESGNSKAMLVTGAAGGLGSALAAIAAGHGWRVVIADNDKRGLERCYDSIVASGASEPYMYATDLAKIGPEDCKQLAEAISTQLGGLNALVHCAVSFSGLQPLDLIEPEDWLQQIQVNVNAPWLLSRTLLPLLKQSSNTHLIFVVDELAESRALWGAYATSKSALRSLAAQFKSELKNTKLHVHAIDPGPMRTPLRSSVFHSENPKDIASPRVRAEQIFAILDSKESIPELLIRLV